MYNYNNLSDFEFEILCKDIMQKKLRIKWYMFQKGRDGGIDVTNDPKNRNSAYMEDIEADAYYVGYDIGDLLNHNMRYNGY